MSLRSSRDDGPVTPKPNNIETKSLEYEVEILDVQFNHTGRYFIKMTIQSLHTRDYSKVRLSAVRSSKLRRHKKIPLLFLPLCELVWPSGKALGW